MALTQDDRIAISKKLIDIPRENASADLSKSQIEAEKIKVQKQDTANKNVIDGKTILINLYQSELERYDGDGHTQLVEQDMQDSVVRVKNNPFFPNDPLTPIPNVPDGVWKNFPAFSDTRAIGKSNFGAYASVTKEQDLIDDVNAKIAVVESFVDATRSSGNKVIPTGTCSNPIYTDQTSCVNGGGIWTPGGDITVPDTAMAAAGVDLENSIQAWEDFVNTTYGFVPTAGQDPDAGRLAQNDSSRSDITAAIVIIDAWQALQDYDTVTATPGTVAAFNAFASSNFVPSKFRDVEIQAIKDEITARQTFISGRITEIDTVLGSINQNFTTGEIVGTTGFFGDRFRFIDLRLNAVGGSLSKLKAAQNGQDAQDESKQANANAEIAYSSVLLATGFRSPGLGTTSAHVLDSTGFSASDAVFIVSDDRPELPAVIQSIDGNRIVLDIEVPKHYRENEGARLYKEL